ncbi:MAG TPA: M23 family metallopeptidase [Ignavibacteriaceae bacterium]|nr:M23 family metallopeptidase [Ignavibacteriaceae bacterium]
MSLRNENQALKRKLLEISSQYETLNHQIDSISKRDRDLRLAADLEPVSDEEKSVGIGGGSFDISLDFLNDRSSLKLKDALAFVDEVSRKIKFEKSQYDEITNQLKENKNLYASMPAIKPCSGTVEHDFGMRFHPILGIRRMHEGIDILADRGTPVHATGNGKIDFVGYRGGFGLVVEINHGFGYRTIYAHLSKTLVKRGTTVKRGELIAKSGSSGLATGPHLHYEVHHNGVIVNPLEFFFDDMAFFDSTNSNIKE